ncbi:MAG: tetratricopeptide repeat protein [Leptospiraceae bacterium]|nr:tetratricopeptide repeat protein [Leptospiraceae bacterium]
MRKSKIVLNHIRRMIPFLFIIISLALTLPWIDNCTSATNEEVVMKVNIKPGVNPEYLTLSEKIFLDFYGGEEKREESLSLLKQRCENESSNNSHACYNLAVLLFNLKRYDESLEFIQKAVEKSPEDLLYSSMLRTMAGMMNKPEKLELGKEGSMLANITRLEVACRNKNEEYALQLITQLKETKVLNSSLFRNGSFSDCLSSENKKIAEKEMQRPVVNYRELYYKEKALSDSFSGIWDVSYFLRKNSLENEKALNSRLTELWKNVRLAVKSGNGSKARGELRAFLQEIKEKKNSQKGFSSKYTAIERAAYLLIEQDDFFMKTRDLLQEF